MPFEPMILKAGKRRYAAQQYNQSQRQRGSCFVNKETAHLHKPTPRSGQDSGLFVKTSGEV